MSVVSIGAKIFHREGTFLRARYYTNRERTIEVDFYKIRNIRCSKCKTDPIGCPNRRMIKCWYEDGLGAVPTMIVLDPKSRIKAALSNVFPVVKNL